MTRLVGEELRARGALSRQELAVALGEQRRSGGPLGRILLARGSVSRRELYDSLATLWGLEFVDLVSRPPQPDLVASVDPDVMLRNHWIPLRREVDGGRGLLVVATVVRPTPDLERSVRACIPCDDVEFVVTTDWDVERAVLVACEEPVVERIAYGLVHDRPELSAHLGDKRSFFPAWTILIPLAILLAAVLAPLPTLFGALLVLNTAFLLLVLFKAGACVVGVAADVRRTRSEAHWMPPRIRDRDLPRYTILVPAYHEANVVSKVIDHLGELDYPKSKLQVIVLLEPDDEATIEAAKEARPPDWVRFYVVPPGGPKTKPRACNLGLALAQGEFLTIYDAEDRPQPDQLRRVVAAFRDADDEIVCVQARLNYFNSRENFLTRMFTLEYTAWFDAMLPGLDQWKVPLPLGGTSNHFRTESLRELGGWDPYNVTEDADLGIRASVEGGRIATIPSTTWEEACSEWRAWVRQRTRWIKGYMVTSFVHLRRPRQLVRALGVRGTLGFLALVAGTPITFLIYPIVLGFWLFTFLGGNVPGFHLPSWVGIAAFANFAAGNLAMIAVCAIAAWRRGARDLAPYAILNPVYWVLHSLAAWRALLQLVHSPFHWEKTPHGIEHGPYAGLAVATADHSGAA
jgi:cellulose synthase/poly-beta-1,6-N-acetylglucosamine synthase-like glycosyltransferase